MAKIKPILLIFLPLTVILLTVAYFLPLETSPVDSIKLTSGEDREIDAIIEASNSRPQLLVFLRHFG